MADYQEGDTPMGATTNLAAPQTSPLASTLTVHENNHGQLNEALAELEHKLGPLLRPQEPTNEKAAGEALTAPPRSDLVAGIDDSNQRLRRYTQRVRVLLERLEI